VKTYKINLINIEMEIYENKDFNSDDDNATVRGDESEAEHIDFPTFSNDD
ncbi:9885_t:CDS:1, partial [Entrophospora sp. SA101]